MQSAREEKEKQGKDDEGDDLEDQPSDSEL